jgi:hypothetical protein
LWADKVRRELSKIAERKPADRLTETERRVAALIAQGNTNRAEGLKKKRKGWEPTQKVSDSHRAGIRPSLLVKHEQFL